MKLLKFITNRTFLTILSVLIQIILFVILLEYLSNKILYLITIIRIISYFVVFFVFILDTSPTNKLPWILILLLFPLLGLILFFAFGNHNMARKVIKKFKEEEAKSRDYLNSLGCSIDNIDNLYKSQAVYLNKIAKVPVYSNTKVKYLNDGEVFFKAWFENLKKAKKFIFLEYFIFSKGKIWNELLDILKTKQKEGVLIYILYDDIGASAHLPHKMKKELRASGIHCEAFNHLTVVASALQNHRDHRKITVIDGEVGFTGGINIADEYANLVTRCGVWKDSGLQLNGEAVNTLTTLFIEMWNVSNKEKLKYKDFITSFPKENENQGFIIPFGDGPSPFDADHIGEETFINMVSMAKDYIYITTPYLIIDYHLMQLLKVAAKKGIDVRIITPHIPDKKIIYLMTKNSYFSLTQSGVKIYEYTPGFMHSKTWISDDVVAMNGSINLDYRSLVHHFECGVWMTNNEVIMDMKSDFLETLKYCQEITNKKAKLNIFQKFIRNIIAFFSPLL